MLAKTAIIIVNYKTPWYLQMCLDSIFTYTKDFHIYLVSNSTDIESKRVFESFKLRYPHQITLYYNQTNTGFVGGVNTPYQEAILHERICLVNSDTIMYGNWLSIMNEEMDNNPNISQIVPDSNCYYADSFLWKLIKIMPSPISRLQLLQLKNPKKAEDSRGFKADEYFLAIAGGFCTLFKSEHISKRGYILDPNIAHGYWDDLDLTLFLRQFGDIGSTNKSYVYHFTNASFKILGNKNKDPRKQALSDWNGFYIFQKWREYFEQQISNLSVDKLYELLADKNMQKFSQYYALYKLHPQFGNFVDSLPAKQIWEQLKSN